MFLVLCFMHPMLHYGGLGIFSSFFHLHLYFWIFPEQREHISEPDTGGRTETWTVLWSCCVGEGISLDFSPKQTKHSLVNEVSCRRTWIWLRVWGHFCILRHWSARAVSVWAKKVSMPYNPSTGWGSPLLFGFYPSIDVAVLLLLIKLLPQWFVARGSILVNVLKF